MRAVIYSRFSSDRQRSESIDQQNKVCVEFCERKGYTVIGIYSDHALTGRTDSRPQFLRMIEDSKKHEFDLIVVYALDRFSRSVYDSCHYEDILNRNGVKLLSATEPLTDDPAGVMVKQIFRGFAEYYSAELSAKIRRGLDDNASKYLCNGKPPYGFDRGPDGRYVVNEQEAVIVREIFTRVSEGEQLTSICRSLNERGLRTKTGAEWTLSSLNKFLSNVRYIGTYVYKGEQFPNKIPAIVEENLFYRVQTGMKTKTNPRNATKRRRTQAGLYLLTGTMFCGLCGEPMTATAGTGKCGELHRYYICNGRKWNKSCRKSNIKKDYIEEKVARALRDIVLDDGTIRWMAENAIKTQNERYGVVERQIIESELKQVKMNKSNLLKAILTGIITETTKEAMLECEAREKELEARLSMIDESEDPLTIDDVVSYLELFRRGNIESKRIQQGLIDAFVTRVDLFDDHAVVTFMVKKEDRQTIVSFAGDDGVRLPSISGEENTLNEPVYVGHGIYRMVIAA